MDTIPDRRPMSVTAKEQVKNCIAGEIPISRQRVFLSSIGDWRNLPPTRYNWQGRI
jgi:hypothetical protein